MDGKKQVHFLTSQKLFDCVDFYLMFNKLNMNVIKDLPLQWLQSYIMIRKQVAQVKNVYSDPISLKYGIPRDPFWYQCYLHSQYV